MRLIDADALREHMYHEAFETDSGLQKWDSGLWIRYQMFESVLNTEITIDAEPVRHGYWIRPYNDHYKQCSVCGRVHYSIPWNAEYCPFCGAKMDGGTL